MVMNISQIDNRRLRIDFSVSYDDRARIEPICNELAERLKVLPDVNPAMELWVLFTGYGASSLDCRLVCCSQSGDRIAALHLQHQLLLLIGDVVQAHGASMPFTRTRSVGRSDAQLCVGAAGAAVGQVRAWKSQA